MGHQKSDRAASPPSSDFQGFRTQETTLILINLVLMALVLLLQLLFQSVLGWPSRSILLLFGARFIMQTAELQWLSARERPLDVRTQFLYGRISILMHLVFAAAVSLLSSDEDTHYAVLLILPVIAGGFRTSLRETLCIAGGASLVCLLEVWDFSRRGGPDSPAEYFEAFGTILIFFLVGTVVWLLASSLRKEQRHLQRTMAELERTRDRLVQQEKLAALGRLSSGIAHEIRNPIAMISSSLAMARDCAEDTRLGEEMLSIATQEAQRLEQFTTEFLAYARNREPRFEPASAESMIRYVAEVSRAHAARNGLRIECDCAEELLAQVEPFQLHQALINLVSNSIDASPAGSTILLGCKAGRDGVISLFVQNAGEAIPPATVPQLLEPFFTTKARGTGLGLAIAAKIAEAHHGSLELENNEPGAVRFTINLPKSLPDRTADDEGSR